MIRIGLTGGIGMGKSTAASLLAEKGIPVVDTDVLAREVVAPGQPALGEILNAFGADVLSSDGTLRREALAAIVFSNDAKRRELEAILHPRIRERWLDFLKRCETEGRAAAFVVIPLLFETGAEKEFDRVVCTSCTPATQMKRLSARGWTEEQSRQRLASQWPTQKKIDHSHSMIWTEVSRDVHGEQWDRVLRRFVVK
ncbi:MAG: dephospho-CoA kinase [Verrucomicrobia bacterium]|nr:dephospho-CoA kinase [Verrucomicrobiota bacterium]